VKPNPITLYPKGLSMQGPFGYYLSKKVVPWKIEEMVSQDNRISGPLNIRKIQTTQKGK
jgi:hypothetical protein